MKSARWSPESPNYGGSFDVENKQRQLNIYQGQIAENDFWADQDKAQTTLQQMRRIETDLSRFRAISDAFTDLQDFY